MLRPLCLVLLALALPAPALAKGGDEGDRGSCGRGATSELRVQSTGGGLRLRFRVDTRRTGTWRVTVAQERRVVLRTTARARSGSFRVERTLRDLPGSDTVTVRASGPGGLTCNASVTLWG